MSGCAVGSDGKLLDAADIVWFEDVDSSEPINSTTTPSGPSSITASNSPAAIPPLNRGEPESAVVAPGARRSGRATRPSIRIADPDNAAASAFVATHQRTGPITNPDNANTSSSATMHKRKASRSISMAAGRRINRKVVVDVDDEGSTDGNELNEFSDYEPDIAEHPPTSPYLGGHGGGDTEPEPDEDDDIGYAATKAMGDADRQASRRRAKADRTADIRTIFVKVDDHVDPDTGAKEEGHICQVCRLVSSIFG